ncbi:DUF6099 family protein [Streptomyces sannanensis]|uniref:DUF6099 family protein n=1 Tax=Streptomyces sannanensis TaxID=285536 RepID=A0ABP6SHR6_9ACTN
MDAVRLIAVTRSALARSPAAWDIVAEAWQAQALAQAIGSRLALTGPPELRGEARALGEVGDRGCVTPAQSVPGGALRAARLSEVAEPARALTELGALLGEVGTALVGVACATDEEALYWHCIEAIDAADESSDHVRGMLRRLAVRDRDRAHGGVRSAVQDSPVGPPDTS